MRKSKTPKAEIDATVTTVDIEIISPVDQIDVATTIAPSEISGDQDDQKLGPGPPTPKRRLSRPPSPAPRSRSKNDGQTRRAIQPVPTQRPLSPAPVSGESPKLAPRDEVPFDEVKVRSIDRADFDLDIDIDGVGEPTRPLGYCPCCTIL